MARPRRQSKSTESPVEQNTAKIQPVSLKGIPASPGIAIGHAFIMDGNRAAAIAKEFVDPEEVPQQINRFEEALAKTRQEIVDVQKKIQQELGGEQAEIFNAHLMVLEDRTFIEEVIGRIKSEHLCCEYVVSTVLKKYIDAFSQIEDEYMRERTADVEDVGHRILRHLTGKQRQSPAELQKPVIVVAHDLSPSDTASMDRDHVLGFVTAIGGPTSHTAIMAKSIEIPAVVGVDKAIDLIRADDLVIVDGTSGRIIINPEPSTLDHYRELREKLRTLDEELLRSRDLPAETPDGHRVQLCANIELAGEIPSVMAHGADGIGLYRTEFFYLNRKDLPTEEEQYEAYRQVASSMAPHPVTIRSIDLGGDKFISALRIPREINPFMGQRAIRFCLARPDLFKVQLRAILRASVHGKIKLMYPMISGLDELRSANAILDEAKKELTAEKQPFDEKMEVGAMIEVPSAAMILDLLAKEVSFFSIGTNDLIQYSLAVDRVNEKIAYLYEPAHPAVLRLIRQIIQVAHENNVWVGMCGEMAGEPAFALLLLGMGLDGFSTSPVNIPRVKQVIRSVPTYRAKEVVKEVFRLATGKEIEAYVRTRLCEFVPDQCEL
jgi:phosphotransferase system enzyme I (PtsI)